jgi:2-keto-4-pentenoate hydratase/2-oxohepta-3-ene-1,7-dioic acid hydratase in catechol pathway
MTVNTTPAYALGTFSVAGSPAFPGLVIRDKVIALTALETLNSQLGVALRGTDSMLSVFEYWPQNAPALAKIADYVSRHLVDEKALPATPIDVALLKVHAPVTPRQFLCSGANYHKHVVDLIVDQSNDPAVAGESEEVRRAYAENLMNERAKNGFPYIFSKLQSSITGPFDPIIVPDNVEQPDWELELAVVIGKPAFHVSQEDALDYVAGYTIANDISNRELIHRKDLKAIGTDWVMGKSCPTYTPIGPYIVPASLVEDPQNLLITLKLNGEVMQNERTSDMIFPITRLIEYLSSRIQLLPGDILITGSPSGNGSHYNRFLKAGDVLEGTIENIGIQRNVCVS